MDLHTCVVHHSGSKYDTFDSMLAYHTAPKPDGNGWEDIGYHFVIERDGVLNYGRPLPRQGAHAYPNAGRIGVCVVGDNTDLTATWTPKQVATLQKLWLSIQMLWPTIELLGHREAQPNHTACPGLNVRALLLGPTEVTQENSNG
jgi:N-acetyl-anhydromuramyl-L-alanine amidase AmpD